MSMTLKDACALLDRYGMAPALDGDAECEIHAVATLDDATEGQVSFLSNQKYERQLATTGASAVVMRPDVQKPDHLEAIRVADPYAAITALIVAIHGYRKHAAPPRSEAAYVHPTAQIGEHATIHAGATIDADARIGANAVIYAGCYIGPRCRIGDDVLLYPNVVIYDDCILGDRVTIHAGTVIGNDGLGYAPVNGQWVKIPQIGIAEIGDDVEIGSNCSIDRATLGRTKIGRGTKMSNLIAVGHGTQIGAHCMIVAQTGLAGSVTVGDHVTMAGQAGVVGHIRIGDHATIAAKAGVTNDVPDGVTVLGQPAIPIGEMRRQVAAVQKLPEMMKTVKRLRRELEATQAELAALKQQADQTQASA